MFTEFLEKPQAGEGLINGGYFVFDHRLWDYMNETPSLIFEQEPLRGLAAAGQLAVFEHHGFWQPMDTFREWKLLNDLWDRARRRGSADGFFRLPATGVDLGAF